MANQTKNVSVSKSLQKLKNVKKLLGCPGMKIEVQHQDDVQCVFEMQKQPACRQTSQLLKP
jgi:hypothetical protein